MNINLSWDQRKRIAESLRNEVNDIEAGDLTFGTRDENLDEIAFLEEIIDMMEEDD